MLNVCIWCNNNKIIGIMICLRLILFKDMRNISIKLIMYLNFIIIISLLIYLYLIFESFMDEILNFY